MGHGPGRPVKTRGRPRGHGGLRRSSSSSSTPHLMRSGPGRPVKTHGPSQGPGGAAHVEPTSHGPRPGPAHRISRGWAGPGPAHQIFRGWAAARPGPSKFQRMGRGSTQPITLSIFRGMARPGPSSKVSARPVTFFRSARPGPAQTNGPWQALVFLPLRLWHRNV